MELRNPFCVVFWWLFGDSFVWLLVEYILREIGGRRLAAGTQSDWLGDEPASSPDGGGASKFLKQHTKEKEERGRDRVKNDKQEEQRQWRRPCRSRFTDPPTLL